VTGLMKLALTAAILCALAPAAAAQQTQQQIPSVQPPAGGQQLPPRAAMPPVRRAQLEDELMQRFVQRSSVELGLAPPARNRLQRLLDNGEQQRRTLAQEGQQLQRRLQEALADPTTSDAVFGQILDGLALIRQRELAIWRREQQMLAEFLTPRQRAQFIALRGQFNEALQEIRTRVAP
jgi:uncharacterized membrane protein